MPYIAVNSAMPLCFSLGVTPPVSTPVGECSSSVGISVNLTPTQVIAWFFEWFRSSNKLLSFSSGPVLRLDAPPILASCCLCFRGRRCGGGGTLVLMCRQYFACAMKAGTCVAPAPPNEIFRLTIIPILRGRCSDVYM